MQTNVQIVLDLVDNASSKLTNAGSKLNGLARDFAPISAAAGAAGVAVGLFAKNAVQAYFEYEQATLRMAKLSNNATGATFEQIQSLREQAVALERVGVVSEEMILMAQGTIATFGLQTDSIKLLTPALLDMVVAEKGVNATTSDLIGFANALGGALEGNYGALTQRNFRLSEATKEIIEHGTSTEKTAEIVKVLNEYYKEFNETMRNTAAGSVKALSFAFNDMKKIIGEALLPTIVELAQQLEKVILVVTEWIKENKELTAWLVKWTVITLAVVAAIAPLLFAMAAVVTVAGKVIVAIKLIGVALAFLAANPLMWAVVAIGALVGALAYVHAKHPALWNGIVRTTEKAVNAIIRALLFLFPGFELLIMVLNKFGANIPELKVNLEFATVALDDMGQRFVEYGPHIEEATFGLTDFMGILTNTEQKLAATGEAATAGGKAAAESVKEWEKLEDAAASLADTLSTKLTESEDKIRSIKEQMSDLVLGKVKSEMSERQSLAEKYVKFQDGVAELEKKIAQETQTAQRNIINASDKERRAILRNEFEEKLGLMKAELAEKQATLAAHQHWETLFGTEINAIREFNRLDDLEKAHSVFSQNMLLIQQEFDLKNEKLRNELIAETFVKEQIIALKQEAADATIAVLNSVESQTSASIARTITRYQALEAAARRAGEAQAGAMGMGSLIGVARRAVGGFVTAGRTFMVGENGPEFFTPSTSGSITPNGSIGGSTNVTVNVTGNSISSKLDLRSIADEIGNQIIGKLKMTRRMA